LAGEALRDEGEDDEAASTVASTSRCSSMIAWASFGPWRRAARALAAARSAVASVCSVCNGCGWPKITWPSPTSRRPEGRECSSSARLRPMSSSSLCVESGGAATPATPAPATAAVAAEADVADIASPVAPESAAAAGPRRPAHRGAERTRPGRVGAAEAGRSTGATGKLSTGRRARMAARISRDTSNGNERNVLNPCCTCPAPPCAPWPCRREDSMCSASRVDTMAECSTAEGEGCRVCGCVCCSGCCSDRSVPGAGAREDTVDTWPA
jgi:hypothetical protein